MELHLFDLHSDVEAGDSELLPLIEGQVALGQDYVEVALTEIEGFATKAELLALPLEPFQEAGAL